MSLYEKWQEMAFNHESEQQEKSFWVKYLAEEKEIYVYILEHHTEKIQGTVKELAARFDMSDEFFSGFLDGINGSLIPPIELETVESETEITLPIDFEKLYQEMVEYKADHLYSLPQWDLILTEQKRRELYKQQKKSKTIVKDGKIGRNDPCPCGSAKKYKKCCGA